VVLSSQAVKWGGGGGNVGALRGVSSSSLEGWNVKPVAISVGLLVCSNVFMTFAWYAHLKELNHKPWLIAVVVSWGIALLEYCFQVPANRIGHTVLSVGHLKIIQEVVTLVVFVPFSVWYLREPLKLDYLWAGLCLMGAVFFMFRSKLVGA
jgi:uncharacterized protein (DUF486 family)